MTAHGSQSFDALPPIHDVAELYRVAVAMEQEAARRYEVLARRMDAAGQGELAALFRTLEAQEREHEMGIAGWAQRQGAGALGPPRFTWHSPEHLDEEAVNEAGGEALMTPVQALDLAVHNEERAFAFYVRIATEAEDEPLRDCAERMASEELAHIARLRLARRRAGRPRSAATPRPQAFADTAAAEAWLEVREREAAARLARIGGQCHSLGLTDLASGLGSAPVSGAGSAAGAEPTPDLAALQAEVNAALHETDRAYERLLATAEQAREETLVGLAQQRAEAELQRLAHLNDLRGALAERAAGSAGGAAHSPPSGGSEA